MKHCRWILEGITLVSLISCGKSRSTSTLTNHLDGAPSVGLDVNDVSILFEKTGPGAFYPNIDVKSVWPEKAFKDLIRFSKDRELNGVQFGQFILPPDYAALVNEYTKSPNASIGNDPKRKAAKEIADEMLKKNVQCAPRQGNSLLCTDAASFPNFNNHRIAIADMSNWRIVSMRMDLCAGAHNAETDPCDVEFRLIAQPYGDFAPIPPVNGVIAPLATKAGEIGPFMFDVSAHLLYKLGKLNLDTGNIVDDSGRIVMTANEIIKDLQELKQESAVTTNGRPLGVHPGLRAEASRGSGHLGLAMTKLIQKYTRYGSALTNITSMQISGPATFASSVWVFFQGVIENGGWNPTPITGSNTIWSMRSKSVQGAGGKMFPPPQLQNRRSSINAIFDYELGQTLPAPVADLPSFFDNPGRFGDPSLNVNGRVAASVRNSDCISCHMTTTRAFEWGVRSLLPDGSTRPSFYVPPVGTTAYLDPEVIPRIDYNLRNFGYFLPPPLVSPLTGQEKGLGIFNFAGIRTEKPAVMARVAYESAELVNLINSHFLRTPNPGLVCRSEDPKAALQKGSSDDPFTDEAQNVIRRRARDHAYINDCLMFDAFKPNVSFDSCIQYCMNGQTPPLTPPTPPTRPKPVPTPEPYHELDAEPYHDHDPNACGCKDGDDSSDEEDERGASTNPNPSQRIILQYGRYVPFTTGNGFFAEFYDVSTNTSASGYAFSISKTGQNGMKVMNFTCDDTGQCRELNGNRSITILSTRSFRYTSDDRSVVMNLE